MALAQLNTPVVINNNGKCSVASGSNRVAVAFVTFFTATDATSVTIGGQSMTKVGGTLSFQGGARFMNAWYLVAPPVADNNAFVISPITGGDEGCGIFVFSGADQTTPVSVSGSVAGASVTVNVPSSGNWLTGMMNNPGSGLPTPTGDFTRSTGSNPSSLDSNGTIGTGNQTGSWSGAGANPATFVMSVQPVQGGGTTTHNLLILGDGT